MVIIKTNKIIYLENLPKKYGIGANKNKLVIFHSLANAIGHSLGNGPKKKDNLQRVESFKKLGILEREIFYYRYPISSIQ